MRTEFLALLALLAGCAPGTDDAPADTDLAHTDDTDVDVLPACPEYADGVTVGTVAATALNEISGMVASRAWPGVWWMHNDSGDAARVFAVGATGADLGVFSLPDVTAIDWEDMAIAPAGAGWDLWLGDIGDNLEIRGDVRIWVVAEPDPAQPGTTATPTLVRFNYPNEERHNAETLMADPRTGDAYIVTKSGDVSTVFRAPAPLMDGQILEPVATLTFGPAPLTGSVLTTGGDISADGTQIIVRTYNSAFVWRRTAHQTVGEAMAGEPCPVPQEEEPQGEAIAFDPVTGAYTTVSESGGNGGSGGGSVPMWTFTLKP